MRSRPRTTTPASRGPHRSHRAAPNDTHSNPSSRCRTGWHNRHSRAKSQTRAPSVAARRAHEVVDRIGRVPRNCRPRRLQASDRHRVIAASDRDDLIKPIHVGRDLRRERPRRRNPSAAIAPIPHQQGLRGSPQHQQARCDDQQSTHESHLPLSRRVISLFQVAGKIAVRCNHDEIAPLGVFWEECGGKAVSGMIDSYAVSPSPGAA